MKINVSSAREHEDIVFVTLYYNGSREFCLYVFNTSGRICQFFSTFSCLMSPFYLLVKAVEMYAFEIIYKLVFTVVYSRMDCTKTTLTTALQIGAHSAFSLFFHHPCHWTVEDFLSS